MPKNKSINLLPQEEFSASSLGRVLKWAMGTFRIIVIVTEMVVMGAFLSRFWLDAQNSVLNDQIKVKSAQIKAQGTLEKNFRSVQQKLSIFKSLDQLEKPSARLDEITSGVPNDVTITGINFALNETQVKGVANSELSLNQFVANLKAKKTIKKVNLGQLSTPETNPTQTVFTIKISY